MTFQEAYQWLKWNGLSLGRLAQQGDGLAKEVMRTYQDWYSDKLNPAKQSLVIVRVTEMAKRALTITDLEDLQNQYGYKVDEKPP